MGTIIVFGIEIDERCADYLRLVVKYSWTNNDYEQGVRDRALRNLARNNCRKALLYLIDRYAGSNDDQRQYVKRTAFDYLERLDRGENI